MSILVDTGPLVALLYRREQYHSWSVAQAAALAGPFYTCEAVLTEANFLLRSIPQGTQKLIALVSRGSWVIDYVYWSNRQRVDALMQTYANVPMSFADACLVKMAEHLDAAQVLTFDSGFRIYRKHRNKALSLIIPQ